ncbi:hypothetical protein RclHR1_01830005 [Rhizophagus clarus]|uniref:RNase H type-1 domain-containing protein n=1 Tax=Rhizophagus clarus TaxID=94130 RepID=A0A2Z6RF06_9GLOM|nr:hypothetical protein RclHR1_01830005 [Rhizophagus clarus]
MILNEKALNIHWHKVKGHTGIYGNDQADIAANIGLSSQNYFNNSIDFINHDLRFFLRFDSIPIENNLRKFITSLLSIYEASEWSLLLLQKDFCHNNSGSIDWKITWIILAQFKGFRYLSTPFKRLIWIPRCDNNANWEKSRGISTSMKRSKLKSDPNDRYSKDAADNRYRISNSITQSLQFSPTTSSTNRGVIRLTTADNPSTRPSRESRDIEIYDDIFMDVPTSPPLDHRSRSKRKQQAIPLVWKAFNGWIKTSVLDPWLPSFRPLPLIKCFLNEIII